MQKTFLTKQGGIKRIEWDVWTSVPTDYIWELIPETEKWVKRQLRMYREAGLSPDGEKLIMKYWQEQAMRVR